MVLLMSCVLPAMVFATVGNTTMTGMTGSIVVPSAVPVSTPENPAVTTGYSTLYNTTDGFSHIPFLQISFMDDFEAGLLRQISVLMLILSSTENGDSCRHRQQTSLSL